MKKEYIYFILAVGSFILIIDNLLTKNDKKYVFFSIEINQLTQLIILLIFMILFIYFGIKKR